MKIVPNDCVTMKCNLLLVMVLMINAKAAPYIRNTEHLTQTNQQPSQLLWNQIAQQSMEKWILQNQFNSMQQQLMALQHLQAMEKAQISPVPESPSYNLPQQPVLILLPSTIAKTTNQYENLNDNIDNEPNLKHGVGDADSVVINAANIPETKIVPQRSVVELPNGQRLIIGSIISAIPFLPFEVNVPDTIGWIYNGIAGIIGGIGQRLPFRPRPTTESPVQQSEESLSGASESITPDQGSIRPVPETGMIPASAEESSMNIMEKLMFRRPNIGIPILMLPVGQVSSIQVPFQV